MTALPLTLFAYGARQIPLSTVGLVQYIGPTLQLLVGLLVFHEAFPRTRAVGFVIISGVRDLRDRQPMAQPPKIGDIPLFQMSEKAECPLFSS